MTADDQLPIRSWQEGELRVLSSVELAPSLSFLELARSAMSAMEHFWGPLTSPVSVVLLGSHEQLCDLKLLQPLPPWVTGFTYPPNRYFQVLADRLPHQTTVSHEFCHLFQWEKTGRKLPIWLEEGICEALAKPERAWDAIEIERQVMELPFPRWTIKNLLEIDPRPLPQNAAYAKCASFVRFWIDQQGWPQVRDHATKGISPNQLQALETEWQAAWRSRQ